jgi:hypothetical protein
LVTNHIALPDSWIDLVQKFHKNLTQLPASRDLITRLAAFILGGKNSAIHKDSPIWKSALIVNSVLRFGLTVEVSRQFLYNMQNEGFHAIDTRSRVKATSLIDRIFSKEQKKMINFADYYSLLDDV